MIRTNHIIYHDDDHDDDGDDDDDVYSYQYFNNIPLFISFFSGWWF